MKKIIKKWEGGAKKHGGIGNAMVAQVHVWTEQEEQRKAKEQRKLEEQRKVEEQRKAEASRVQALAEERASAAEALAKAALERNEKLKAQLREAQAKLAMEQAAREEQELLDQLKQMQSAQKAPEEEKSRLSSYQTASEERGEEPVSLLPMEALAKQIATKAIDIDAIRLTQEKYNLLVAACMAQFGELSGETRVLSEDLDGYLDIIESNVIGDVV